MHQELLDLSQAKARLHLSESPFPLPESFRSALIEEVLRSNIYPEPSSVSATKALADHWNIPIANLVLGNGCDEIILNSFLKFGQTGKALITANSYPGYHELAQLANQQIATVPLKDWRIDIDAIIASITPDVRLATICNPHNPTGSILTSGEIDRFIHACEDRGVIPVVDEAYIEFSQDGRSLIQSIGNYKNLLVLRSFAKSHGLAGIRLGAAVGTPGLIAKLKEAADSNPFSVNRLAQRFVLEIARDEAPFKENQHAIKLTRAFMEASLDRLGIWHTPSNTNFLFMRAPQGLSAKNFFNKTGVLVCDCEGYELPGYWRVSCGSKSEMQTFLDALKVLSIPKQLKPYDRPLLESQSLLPNHPT